MYSFVFEIAILVKKAVELINTIPILGLIKNMVELPFADPNPIKISVVIDNTFLSFKFFYIYFNILYQF